MPDPVLLGLLQALQQGDTSAQPALVDYLLERNDPRAEMVRHSEEPGAVARLFNGETYVQSVVHRLEARGLESLDLIRLRASVFEPRARSHLDPFDFAGLRDDNAPQLRCYLTRQIRLCESSWNPFYYAEAVTIVELPVLAPAELERLTAASYQLACEAYPGPPITSAEMFYLSFTLAVVPGVSPATAEAVRRSKLRRRWRMIGWGFEVPLIFDPLNSDLHRFQKLPLLFDRGVHLTARTLIDSLLLPAWPD